MSGPTSAPTATAPRPAVVNDIRKDFAVGEQDSFEVILDTFGDRRNGYMFITNVEGARVPISRWRTRATK